MLNRTFIETNWMFMFNTVNDKEKRQSFYLRSYPKPQSKIISIGLANDYLD